MYVYIYVTFIPARSPEAAGQRRGSEVKRFGGCGAALEGSSAAIALASAVTSETV